MSITVVLVRHGKAEPKKEGQPDDERRLTEHGRVALSNAFPTSFSLLDPPIGDIQLWVSPTVRARQTAKEVSRVVTVTATEEHQCLRDQDVEAFLDEVDATDDGMIIAVGHVPFMNDVSGVLCGAKLPFGPGAVAAIEIPGLTRPADGKAPGRLLWFVQGPKVVG